MLPINTPTVLLDSSTAKEDEGAPTDTEIEKAHVIILVYDVNNVECIRRLKTNWLPRIAKVNDRVSGCHVLMLLFRFLSYWLVTR